MTIEATAPATPVAESSINPDMTNVTSYDSTSDESLQFLKDRGLLESDITEEAPSINEVKEDSPNETEVEEASSESKEDVESGKPEVSNKILKLKVNGKELDVPESTEIEVKVDGKVEHVSIFDLKQNYSGKVSYDKKYQQLDVMKKEFEDNVKTLDHKLNDCFKTMNRDAEAGIKKLFKMAKRDDFDDFMQKLRSEYEELQSLSEEERNLRKERKKLDAEKADLEEARTSKQLEEQRREIDAYSDEMLSNHGIAVKDFALAAQAIKKAFSPEELKNLSAKDLVDKTIEVCLFDRDLKFLDSIVSRADASKVGDKAFRQDIFDVLKGASLEFNEENLTMVVDGLLGRRNKKENSDKAANIAKPGATSEDNVADSEGSEDLGALVRSHWF